MDGNKRENIKPGYKVAIVFIIILIGVVAYLFIQNKWNSNDLLSIRTEVNNQGIVNAFEKRLKGVEVKGTGKVAKILSDDDKGDRHQRFILRLESGQTVLIAHNIDVAPRLKGLKKGDIVQFYGEYEWNYKGGVIHWTHHDTKGHHKDGWIKYDGKVFK